MSQIAWCACTAGEATAALLTVCYISNPSAVSVFNEAGGRGAAVTRQEL